MSYFYFFVSAYTIELKFKIILDITYSNCNLYLFCVFNGKKLYKSGTPIITYIYYNIIFLNIYN